MVFVVKLHNNISIYVLFIYIYIHGLYRNAIDKRIE